MFKKRMVLCFCIVSMFFIWTQANAGSSSGKVVGGPCEYEHFSGKCRITTIRKTSDSVEQKDAQGGPGYEGYEVGFEFISPDIGADEGISYLEQRVLDVGYHLRGSHTLQLENSWYPGPEFIKKYKINKGAEFDCTLDVIKKGTCTPVNFSFDAIDLNDYFESKK